MHSTPLLQDAPGRAAGRQLDRSAWRVLFTALAALSAALLLALYSRVAAENAQVWLAGLTALAALGIAGWVAATLVPALARRTSLGWLSLRMDYRVTREDGKEIWATFVSKIFTDDQGRVVRQVGAMQNITERKIAEAEMRAAKAQAEENVITRRNGMAASPNSPATRWGVALPSVRWLPPQNSTESIPGPNTPALCVVAACPAAARCRLK